MTTHRVPQSVARCKHASRGTHGSVHAKSMDLMGNSLAALTEVTTDRPKRSLATRKSAVAMRSPRSTVLVMRQS